MRLFFLWAFMSFCLISYAQKNVSSYLPEFEESDTKKDKTIDKIKADILALADTQIKQEIEEKKLQHFNLSVIFIIDGNGKVVTDDIRFMSEIESIEESITKYIASLPTFVPKKTKENEHRDVYIIKETYISKDDGKSFYEATNDEVREKGIKTSFLKLDEYPTYPGCGDVVEDNYYCVAGKLRDIFVENIIIPRSLPDGTNRAFIKFIVNTDGSIEIDEIDADNNDFKREIRRIFKKVPSMTPGKISGIPLRASFRLPLTLNVE